MDKRQLVNGCKSGDPASVEALYRGYSGKLMGICRYYVDSQEVAEDCCTMPSSSFCHPSAS